MCHDLYFHSPTEGHLGCFQILASMNKAAVNIHMQVFQFLWVKTKGHNCESYGKSIFNFRRKSWLSRKVAVPFCTLTSDEREFLSVHTPVSIWWCQCSPVSLMRNLLILYLFREPAFGFVDFLFTI